MNFYVDAYLASNLGDDLFVKILAESFPNILFTVNYYGKYCKTTFSQQKNILFPQYPTIFKLLNRTHIYDYINDADRISSKFDGFILLGGSIFREEPYWKSVYAHRSRIINAFQKANKPVLIIGANFGPVQTRSFIVQYAKLFQMSTDVCFRDSYSYGLFSELQNVRLERDVIFQYDFPKIMKNKKLIGFSVIDPEHIPNIRKKRDTYKLVIAKTIKEYISKGFRCRILAFCEAEGDVKIASEIMSMLNDNEKKYIEIKIYDGCIEQIVAALGECSVLVASRFHANVLGLLSGAQLIPLIYSDKTRNLLKDSSFLSEIIDIAEIDANTHIINTGYVHKFPVKEYKESARRQFTAITGAIS